MFGGDVDPAWKPNGDELRGRIVGAVIAHKDPNDQGQVYPKIANFVPYRGKKSYSDVVATKRDSDESSDDPPF